MELQLIASLGMPASRYPSMLQMIESGQYLAEIDGDRHLRSRRIN